MREVFVFHPPRRSGMLLYSLAFIAFALIGVFCLWLASTEASGTPFLILLIAAVIAISILPYLIYRLVALQRARYILATDGISIYWGLRREDIPISQVTWVGSADQNRMKLSKPFLRLPGAVLGSVVQPDKKMVEFIASRDSHLVVIVTTDRVFAISPMDDSGFLSMYRKLSEFGSLASIPSTSVYPVSLLARAWTDRPARILLIISLVMAIAIPIWVSLSIPGHPQTTLRLNADGSPVELMPGIRLLLLPAINTFFWIANLLLGLFFYRRSDTKVLGYLMWACSSLSSLVFLGAIFFILRVT